MWTELYDVLKHDVCTLILPKTRFMSDQRLLEALEEFHQQECPPAGYAGPPPLNPPLYAPSPTLSPTDRVPRGLLTLCPAASSGPQGLYTAYTQPIHSLYTACTGCVLGAEARAVGRLALGMCECRA